MPSFAVTPTREASKVGSHSSWRTTLSRSRCSVVVRVMVIALLLHQTFEQRAFRTGCRETLSVARRAARRTRKFPRQARSFPQTAARSVAGRDRVGETELLDPIADLIAIHAEKACRLRLIAAGAPQRLHHQTAFQLLETHPRRRQVEDVAARGGRRQGAEIADVEPAVLAQQHRP